MNNIVANRYARSIFELAKEENLCDEIYGQLKELSDLFKENKEFLKLLSNFAIFKEDKLNLINKTFKNEMNKYILNLLKLLINKFKIQYIDKIWLEYKTLYYNYKDIKEVLVISTVPLKKDLKNKIKKSITQMINKSIILLEAIDKNIIGGLIIKFDNKMYDASLKNNIINLKKALIPNVF